MTLNRTSKMVIGGPLSLNLNSQMTSFIGIISSQVSAGASITDRVFEFAGAPEGVLPSELANYLNPHLHFEAMSLRVYCLSLGAVVLPISFSRGRKRGD